MTSLPHPLLAISIAGLFLCGCAGDHRKTVESARTVLPIAVQMEELYGSADHFITHFGWRNEKTNLWNTVVYFGGRYELTMQVEIQIDYSNNRFTVVGDPKFYMIEVERVADGRIGKNFRFSEEDWKTLYEHGGDFSTIGIELDPSPVPDFDKYVDGWRKDRLPVISLIEESNSNSP